MITFSKQEEFLSNFIGKMKCLSMSQVHLIMNKYFNCSKGQVNIMLKELSSRQHLTVSEDEKFVLAGGAKSSQREKMDRENIICLYYALDQITDLNELEMMYKPSNGATFSYIADNELYQILYLTSNTLSKILILQSQYIDIKREVTKEEIDDSFAFKTVFVFGPSEDEKEVLEELEKLDIVMPHILVFMKTKDISEKPQYVSYSAD